MKRISLANLPGLLLILLGFLNIVGWYAHVPILITQFPNNVGMVINAAVCFVVAGAGLYLPELFPAYKKNIYRFAGIFLSLFALLILSEYLFDYSSGIDSLLITPWLVDVNLHAGRMSNVVAAAFLMAGVIFLLEPYSHRKPVAVFTQILMFCVTFIGASTLAGIVFNIDLLSTWYGYTSMNVFAAAGLIILGIGFLSAWTRSDYYHQFYKGHDDKKIILTSAIILFFAVFVSNVMGFVSYARNDEAALRNIMIDSLTGNANIVNDRIGKVIDHFNVILTSRPVQRIATHAGKADDGNSIAELLSTAGITGIQITDNSGRIVYKSGSIHQYSEAGIALPAPYQASFLRFDKQYILKIRRNIIRLNKIIGTMTIESIFMVFNRISHSYSGVNNENDIYLCSMLNLQHLQCLPPLANGHAGLVHVGLHDSRLQHSSDENPMLERLAIDGQMNMVLYKPIGNYGLGLLLKKDMSQFYQPLRGQLAFVIPVLLVTIGLGCLFLYLQVAPLVRRIVRLKNKALASKIRLRAIMDHIADAIVTIDANGIIETINQEALTMFVCEAEDMIGKKLAEFVSALGDASSPGNNVLCLGENVTEETQGCRLNGVFFPLELVMTRMHLRKQQLYVCIMRDVTLRKEVDAKLQDSEARFHTAFDIAPIGMALVGLEGNIMLMNPALCKIFGYDQHEVTQLNLKSITHPDDLELTFVNIKQVLDGVIQSVKFEKRYYHKSGRLIWTLVNVSVIRGVASEPRYLIAQIQDITEQKESEEQLHYRAHFDPLTGLANRSMLEESLDKIIASAERNEKKFAVFYLDLDRFKEVNDTLGHDAGDRLLKIVGERLKVDTRKNDIIARIGGDEFVLVLTELNDYKTAASFAERIIASLLQPITIKRHELFITASIGISFYPSDGLDSDKLLKNADNALYRAKESGRNNYQFCASEVSKKIKDKMLFERDMQQALAREEFKIYYLPIISTANKCVSSVEALLRWQSGQFGLISPQQIIPVAEETGLIVPLSEWVIKTACNQLLAIQKSSASAVNLTVNISARHFMQYHLIESIIKVLQESGFDSSSFMLEINENLIMQDPTLSMDVIRNLKQYGIGVVVDNFGTGFSSLRQLQQYDIDFIKIDRSLVQNIFSGPQHLELVQAIITLAKNLSIKVIAEGVESREQYDFMAEHGCDEIQGYYISKPMLGSDLKRFLEKSRAGVDLTTV